MNRVRWLVAAGSLGFVVGIAAVVGTGAERTTSSAALVTKKGCEPTITSPVLEPGARLTISAGGSLAVTLSGRALRCPSTQLRVYSSASGAAVDAGEALLGTATTTTAGAWTFGPTTVADARQTTLRVEMTSSAGKTTSTAVVVDADTGRPSIAVVSPAPDDWGRVRIVAPAPDGGCGSGGNVHADRGEPGWVYDRSCSPGGQVEPTITVTGGAPGTLSVWYADAGLASVPLTASPQTLTAAQLGTWTLPEYSREDLVIRVDRQPDGGAAGGTTTRTLMARVQTLTPPPLQAPDGRVGPLFILREPRRASVDVEFRLPSVPPEVPSARITLAWTTSTRRADGLSSVSRGVATVGPSAAEVATPAGAGRGALNITSVADAGTAVWCSNSPSVAPDAGMLLLPGGSYLLGDPNGCNGWPTPAPVYCVTGGGAQNVVVTELGFCRELTRSLLEDPAFAERQEVCHLLDPAAAPQTWTCADGRTYRPGDVYVVRLQWLPPLNVYWFDLEQVW